MAEFNLTRFEQKAVCSGDKVDIDCKRRNHAENFDYIDKAAKVSVNFRVHREYIRIMAETFNNSDKEVIKEIISKAIDVWFERK